MTWLELSTIANQRVLLGLGALLVCLDKRGLDLTQPEISLSLPPDGERIIDWLMDEEHHCFNAYVSEKRGTQNAPEYRK